MFDMLIKIFKFFIVDSSILLLLLLKLGLMALRTLAVVKPVWMKQAEEAKLKSEAEKAALEATFRYLEKSHEKRTVNSDSESDEYEDLAHKPIGPVDPSKCTAAGTGVAGGTACAPSSFAVVTKDADERKVSIGGADIKVKVTPGLGVCGSDQEGIVKDMGDGTYTVTYVVPKRGNYMVNVECNGKPIMGSPFPVFFSAGYRLHLQVKMESTTSATTKKVKNYMPYDLQLVISSKLPVKSVKRFGCICKSWDLNFENPRFMSIFRKNFISNHHSYYDDGTSLLLNISTHIRYFPIEGWLYSLSGEKFENKHKIDWPSPFPNDNGFDVVGYTTGTLCLIHSNNNVVFWNPATKEFKVIPLSPYVPSRNSVIYYNGFGFDNIRDDYKLIRHVDFFPTEGCEGDCYVDFDVQTYFEPFWEIYSLRSNSWKKLDVDTPPSHMLDERSPGTQLYTEGMCHWWGWDRSKTDNNEMCYSLSSFDLGNEVFIATPITPDMEDDWLWFHLILLNGSIALISNCMGMPTFHISVLGELGVKESWTKLFIIGPLPCIALPVGAGKKGDLFFQKEDDEIVYFDLSTQKTHELGIKGFNAHTLVYKESFIRMDGIYN